LTLDFFIKGILIGLAIAAPVGPVAVLIIRRTIANGRLSGFISGLGVATVDGFYAAVAAFGLTFISNILTGQQTWFRLIGGAFLLYLGIKTFFTKPEDDLNSEKKRSLFVEYISTFFLTITNPITILSFAAAFGGFVITDTHVDYASSSLIVLGVITGSLFWWVLLCTVVNLFRDKFNARALTILNWVSGVVISGFAVAVLISLL
jgi:threonine/homoserine/homoserine lactone efflux protein